MAYVVAHRHGTEDDEFEAYVRLLERWGIDWTNTARTPEPGSRHRWLHVWQREEDAQRFAGELREATRDDGWFVHRLHECTKSMFQPAHWGRSIFMWAAERRLHLQSASQ